MQNDKVFILRNMDEKMQAYQIYDFFLHVC